ncbi:MAG TPA: LamG domain-containing protein, partial [Sedimentisphaerales bacterium]|nr:LamG domain-containing protein [Sedimentisphaerales bacterium]
MCRKMLFLCSLVAALGLADSASADLVAHWNFDERAGNIATDEVGGVVGNVINATWTEGLFSNSKSALEFNGSNAYVNVAGQNWGTFKQVSIAVWLKFDSLPGTYNAIFHEDWTAGGIHFMVRSSRVVGFSLNGRGPNDYNSQGVLEAGQIYHVIATFDITTGRTQIYINGVLDSEGTSSPTASEIFLRSPFTIGSWNTSRYWDGVLDDLRIYDRIVTEEEIPTIMAGIPKELASQPNPEDGMTDVVRDTVLSWTPGEFANTHDVYFGTNLSDVSDAGRNDPRDVLASRSQIDAAYDPPGRLAFGQTYYWRIDEVNAPPTSTIFKGDVWGFTTEPVAYPVAGQTITVTASSSTAGQGPENTVNGSGLAGDLHSDELTAMWITGLGATGPAWIQYEFDGALKLDQMWAWNHNGLLEPAIGFGCKEVTIEYSTNGTDYTALGTTHEFARAPGKAGYAHNTIVDFGGVTAKYVRLTVNSNWGGILKQYGLSEVRFFSIPVLAREPSPVSGTTDVSVDATLSWRAGREAARHDVYLSADEQAVIDGTAPAVTVTSPSHACSLDLAGTYYWRIDEVNDVETPTTWQGDIWRLSTQEYLVEDDFETYNDIEAGQEGSNLVYGTWIDGFGTTTNGSTIGYTEAYQPSMEKTLVYDGKQSVPLFYDNTTASVSEVRANT